jgi:hypothetical protein
MRRTETLGAHTLPLIAPGYPRLLRTSGSLMGCNRACVSGVITNTLNAEASSMRHVTTVRT